jgi:hypothetical protein
MNNDRNIMIFAKARDSQSLTGDFVPAARESHFVITQIAVTSVNAGASEVGAVNHA